ncbi:hypothetical protein LG293_16355 (plasmid) [Citricoccus nitrophenolicus]
MTAIDTSHRTRQPVGVSTGGQFAPEVLPETQAPALGSQDRTTGHSWTQDKTLGPAMEIALGRPLQLGGNDTQFGPFKLNGRTPGFQAVVQDHNGDEHTAEFTAEHGGIRVELHCGSTSDDEVAGDVESFTQDDLDCSTQRLAAVLANPENGLDSRLRESVAAACPVVASAAEDARDLLDVHPRAEVMVARRSAWAMVTMNLFAADGSLVTTGAGAGLDPQYAEGFDDLDQFEVDVPGSPVVPGQDVRAYDLDLMSGRQL